MRTRSEVGMVLRLPNAVTGSREDGKTFGARSLLSLKYWENKVLEFSA